MVAFRSARRLNASEKLPWRLTSRHPGITSWHVHDEFAAKLTLEMMIEH